VLIAQTDRPVCTLYDGMATRVRQPELTRAGLLDAGLQLADEAGLAAASVNRIVAAAGSSKGAFFHHFPSRGDYLIALHRHVHEHLLEEIVAAAGHLTPGRERLLAGATAYLDAFLRRRGVRGFLLDARTEPLVLAEVSRRNEQMADLIEPDLEALGWPEPRAGARLWIAAVAEAAVVEFETGGPHARTRAALAALVRPLGPGR
jgi:AcrR family transcriptional regulator